MSNMQVVGGWVDGVHGWCWGCQGAKAAIPRLFFVSSLAAVDQHRQDAYVHATVILAALQAGVSSRAADDGWADDWKGKNTMPPVLCGQPLARDPFPDQAAASGDQTVTNRLKIKRVTIGPSPRDGKVEPASKQPSSKSARVPRRTPHHPHPETPGGGIKKADKDGMDTDR
ncbi:hypothetical protein BD289DRAFT_108497 [Coniella lustricola]|uniref:Uncharacterized protein n=1 Tax=Coniella lustricola TaxID=2025994 RepID=A0A2T3AGN6_9PEZI|nr:hypothetical protein BD289DRAFT_108497 [Coniella lustricola]